MLTFGLLRLDAHIWQKLAEILDSLDSFREAQRENGRATPGVREPRKEILALSGKKISTGDGDMDILVTDFDCQHL